MFEVLGLSPLAETIYLTVLRHPQSDLESLGNELGIDDVVLRSALDHLASMSLLREVTLPGAGHQTSGPMLEPVPAEIGLARLLAQEQADVARRQQQLEESRAALQSLIESRPSPMSPGAVCGVEHLNGVTEVRSKLAEMAENCEWEVCSFMPRGAQSEETRQTTLRLDERTFDQAWQHILAELDDSYVLATRYDMRRDDFIRLVDPMANRVEHTIAAEWEVTQSVGQLLGAVENKAFASCHRVSDAAYEAAVAKLRSWTIRTYGSLDAHATSKSRMDVILVSF